MTPTDTTTGLHLTIHDRDRLISLWDTEDSARSQSDERYVCLPLTDQQRALLSFVQDDTDAEPDGDPHLTRRDMEETYRNDTGD